MLVGQKGAAESGRVLVVEDDADTGRMLCELLRAAGHCVEWVKRGGDAIRRIDDRRASELDVILLDLMLPDIDGSEVARHVATLQERPVVIILSSRAAGVTAKQPGVLRAFRKPFDVARLLATMADAIHALQVPSGVDDEALRAACAALRADPHELGAPHEPTWELARRVVHLAFDRISEPTWSTAPYDVMIAVQAHHAAQKAERR